MLDISTALGKLIDELDVRMLLRGSEISTKKVFSPSGLLPAIAKRADQISNLCLGYGIGISFEEQSSAELGVIVSFDDLTPHTLRILCIYEVILDIIKFSDDKKNISLNELLYD